MNRGNGNAEKRRLKADFPIHRIFFIAILTESDDLAISLNFHTEAQRHEEGLSENNDNFLCDFVALCEIRLFKNVSKIVRLSFF
jgi:hypothetical protein